MSFSSNALCAKAKAMYGGRLNHEIYEDLSRKQSINEVVTYLKSQTSYSDCLSDINVRNVHREQIENALNKEYYTKAGKLMKYGAVKNIDFYLIQIVAVEIRIIINKLMSLKLKEERSFSLEIPDYLTTKMSFNIYGLINIDSYQELLSYLSKTRYYQVLKSFNSEGEIDVNAIQYDLTELYYDLYVSIIKSDFKGSEQKDLLHVLFTSIELNNITTIYRYKQYFNEEPETIRKSLHLKYGRLSKDFMDKLINASGTKEVMSLLSTSKYAVYEDEKDYVYIEYFAESIQYNIAKRYMRFSGSAPLVYMTYCTLQKVEVDNLKHIIEGIRYGRDASSIEAALIFA